MPELLIKRKKSSYYLVVVTYTIVLFLTIRSLINNLKVTDRDRTLIILLLVVFIALGTFFFINAIIQILKRSPALIINDTGIVENLTLAEAGFIRWENISHCELKKYTGSPHLVIYLKEFSAIMEKLNVVRKKLTEVKVRDLGTPVAINLKLLDFNSNELVSIITEEITKHKISS